MSLLQLNALNLSIGDTPILKSVSLSLDKGQVLGLVGESGSGKSMTALAILGLTPPRSQVSGQITLEDQSLSGADDKTLQAIRGAKIGIIFQEPMSALNPVMTIGDQVSEPLRHHLGLSRKAARIEAQAVLERVGLPAAEFPLSRYPHELSGGQRQRVAIAIAIALKPALLIADEATTALDVTTQAQVLDLLKRLVREDGMGLILITHDLAVVAQMADQVAVMKEGQIVEQGPALQVLTRPQNDYAQRLLGHATARPRPRTPPSPDRAPILKVEALSRHYPGPKSLFRSGPDKVAVDNVSFSIQPGESLGLVGESGCGKSTLLRAILALDPLQSGQVWVGGREFTRAKGAALNAIRRDIQVVFQDPYGSFDPRWKVADLVAENFHLLEQRPTPKEARYRVEKMLDQVGLPSSAADLYAHEFSGGQRQRIALARALITHPAILCLDEAVSALDVSIRDQILDLLADLSERLNLAYLFVTHDLSVVRTVTDRVMIMQKGRIVEEGETEAVFAHPRHPYSQKLLAATPELGRNISALAAKALGDT